MELFVWYTRALQLIETQEFLRGDRGSLNTADAVLSCLQESLLKVTKVPDVVANLDASDVIPYLEEKGLLRGMPKVYHNILHGVAAVQYILENGNISNEYTKFLKSIDRDIYRVWSDVIKNAMNPGEVEELTNLLEGAFFLDAQKYQDVGAALQDLQCTDNKMFNIVSIATAVYDSTAFNDCRDDEALRYFNGEAIKVYNRNVDGSNELGLLCVSLIPSTYILQAYDAWTIVENAKRFLSNQNFVGNRQSMVKDIQNFMSNARM